MAGAKLTFWGWDSPVLHKAVAELSCGWTSGALDLSDTLIIVPTAETVRRLREALAVEAGARDSVVTAPHLWHAAWCSSPRPPPCHWHRLSRSGPPGQRCWRRCRSGR
ncbi:hypothetical protein [Verrucomicrobium spinosum]|uniref:hypothetical protein n=1 Tax=Verrucomicrobium spinosum TaxID=2736 RepID=UPI001C46CF44|nr:hypothetical protein [Verrucomicrobium spinosum]